MALNGLDAYKMTDADSESTLKDLLEESMEKFEHEGDIKAHKNKLLCKYLYYYDNGELGSTERKDSDVLTSAKELGGSASSIHNLLDDTAAGVEVKFEKPEHKELKELLSVAESAKKVLLVQLNAAKDLQLKVKYQDMKLDFDKCVFALETFLGELRLFVASSDGYHAFDDAKLKALVDMGKKLKLQAGAHLDGIRVKNKQAKASICSN